MTFLLSGVLDILISAGGADPLHSTPQTPFLLAWNFSPIPVALLLLAAGAYAYGRRVAVHRGRRPPHARRALAYYVALAAIAIALLGPLDAFADDSFLIHMLQHLVLIIFAAPLLLIGRPVQLAFQSAPPRAVKTVAGLPARWPALERALRVLVSPWTVFVAYNANLVLWHFPRAYTAALENRWLHELEHALFFSTALLYWWIVIDPHPMHHRAKPHAVFGLSFATCMTGNVLALALTFSPKVLYDWYASASPLWGLTPLADQRLGGLVMWSGGAIYFAILFVLLARNIGWLQGADPAPEGPLERGRA